MNYNVLKTNFSSGEISEKMRAREDVGQYNDGLLKMENAIILDGGGAGRRPASHLLKSSAAVTGEADGNFLFPYYGIDGNKYLVSLSVSYDAVSSIALAFYNEDGTIAQAYSASSTSICVYNINDPWGYHYTQKGSVCIITHNSGKFKPIVIQQYDVAPASTLFDIGFLDDGILYRTDITYPASYYLPPFKRYNTDEDVQLYSDTFGNAGLGTVIETPVDCSIFAVDSTGSPVALFTLDADGTADYWKDRYIKIKHATGAGGFADGVVKLGSRVSDSEISAKIYVSFDSIGVGNASTSWSVSEFGGVRKKAIYPRTVEVYQERWLFGGTPETTGVIWASNLVTEAPDMLNLMGIQLIQDVGTVDFSGLGYYNGKTDASPFSMELGGFEGSSVTFMAALGELILGGDSAEYVITGIDGKFSENTKQVRLMSSFGSSSYQPIRAGNSIVYFSRDGKKVRYLKYDGQSYQNLNISIMHPDIVKHSDEDSEYIWTNSTHPTFVNGCFDPDRETIWLLNSENKLTSFRMDETAKTIGWQRHNIGGNSNTDAEVVIESVCLFNNIVTVYKQSNDTVNWFSDIEQFIDFGETVNVNNRRVFLDRSVTGENSPAAATITDTSLIDVEGITAYYYDSDAGEYVVESGLVSSATGVITLSSNATTYVYGFSNSTKLKTMPLESGAKRGVSRGNTTRLDRLVMILYRTFGFKINAGYSEETHNSFVTTEGDNYYTQDYKVDIPHSPDRVAQIVIESDSIFDMNILGLAIKGKVEED